MYSTPNFRSIFEGREAVDGLPFTYEQFSEWFDSYEEKYLEPAREAAVKILSAHLDVELPEIDRIRVKISPGRVKGKERTWRKLELPKYAGRVTCLADIPDVVDDLVGLRITCNNKSDVQRVMDIVCALDLYREGAEPVLEQQCESLRDYSSKPKETGYRAIHVNLCTSVPSGLKRKVITCELQVRTLLQDGWGELTHEDTYKPGSAPPVLVERLSRRMADLLATVDDIAQDLRQELDGLSSLNVEDPSAGGPGSPSANPSKTPELDQYQLALREAAMRYLRDRVGAIERPIDLASLAWELRKKFGQDIIEGWLGFGTFKALLKASAPNVRVTNEPPSHVLPDDYDASIATVTTQDYPDIPDVALILREVDRGFPLVSKGRLNAAYNQLADASRHIDWNDPTSNNISRLNEMTRLARELNAEENPVPRSHLDYIAKSILFSGNLNRPLTAEEVKVIYVTSSIKRIQGVKELDPEKLEEVKDWLA
ncbi:GTP pyrophosphokinase family protein [Streptomyces tubercidicus]|uniref:GTP pyrophosphokinase n=1 Tax=Streptomyces tubercidicus TaxID=47759 RepID=UPI0030E0D564